jgi:hypothetical protein
MIRRDSIFSFVNACPPIYIYTLNMNIAIISHYEICPVSVHNSNIFTSNGICLYLLNVSYIKQWQLYSSTLLRPSTGRAILRRLVAGLSLRRSWFDPGSVHVGLVMDKVALGLVPPPPEYFGFPLSTSFHRCSNTSKN